MSSSLSLREANLSDRTDDRQSVECDRPKVVVVGNGPVGFRLLDKLVARGCHETHQLIAFGEEPLPAYDRVRLTSLLCGESETSLQFADRDWYDDNSIKLYTSERIVGLDLEANTLTSSLGKTTEYETLVLATGSSSFVPPIPGVELAGVFVYRTAADLRRIQEFCAGASTAAVLGGGLLGLEAAKALCDLGMETHVVEMAPVLMPRQLDNAGASLLHEMIERLGVYVHLGAKTRVIRSDGDKKILEFDDRSLTTDVVVISAGIRPRDELAVAAGIDVGPRGGIIVDDGLKTSADGVYAIGECALHRETIYGLAAPGYHMADVLAENLSGGSATFEGSDVSTRLKLMGIDVSMCGDYLMTESAETLSTLGDDAYRKLIVRNGRLVGAVGVGEFPELSRIQEAITKRRKVHNRHRRRFQIEGRLWPKPQSDDVNEWPAGAIVCSCVGVSRGQLTQARDRGSVNAEALATETSASTVCGSCRPLLKAICGAKPEPRIEMPGWRWLMTAAIGATILVALIMLASPLAEPTSVQSTWYSVSELIRDSFVRQVTGFTLLGLSVLAVLLSLRKRWSRFEFLNFGWWRAAHGVIGMLTVASVIVHTTMRMGSNLNFWLMLTFLGLNFAGAVAGIITALESRASGELQRMIRTWRPRLTLLHIVCLWPFPVLLTFHVVAVYYF